MKDWSARIKFVDDTTALEVVSRCSPSLLPILVDEIAHFAPSRGMKLNCKKCKEMVISFLQYLLPQENPIYIDGVLVQTVSSFFLSWSDQVDYVIKKTNSRLYALRELKKAGLIVGDLVVTYSTLIRSCSEYTPPAWSALTKNQSDVIESIQKRALRIIIPGMSYSDALKATGLETLCTRRQNSCKSFMNKFKFDSSSVNPLSGVIARQPDVNIHNYDLRYDPNTMQKTNTERFQNFITVKYNY